MSQAIHDAAVLAERTRISSIVDSPAAEGKEKAAIALALSSDISPAEAQRVLAGLSTDAARDAWSKSLNKINSRFEGR